MNTFIRVISTFYRCKRISGIVRLKPYNDRLKERRMVDVVRMNMASWYGKKEV